MAASSSEQSKMNEALENLQVNGDSIFHLFSKENFPEIIKVSTHNLRSLLLKAIFTKTLTIMIVVPHPGSIHNTVGMLKNFLQIAVDENGQLLPNTQMQQYIRQQFGENTTNNYCFRHFGQYPVIHVNFKYVRCGPLELILKSFRLVIFLAYKEHSYVLKKVDDKWEWSNKNLEGFDLNLFLKYFCMEQFVNLTKEEVEIGLKFLCEVLYAHFKRAVFVLLEGFDSTLNKATFKADQDCLEIVWLISSMMTQCIESNAYVKNKI
ncbi:hypothetical protein ILUMI_10763 [Ignelater luminosus]|uniref:Uncharacterized protein n=1 Tax=Ignelater luminosus TaxID=2038154 RepID=A0A8K0D1S4_IGNLU|nr:hypothetical protein ILUMI_10763 [Ignelater luminosus]